MTKLSVQETEARKIVADIAAKVATSLKAGGMNGARVEFGALCAAFEDHGWQSARASFGKAWDTCAQCRDQNSLKRLITLVEWVSNPDEMHADFANGTAHHIEGITSILGTGQPLRDAFARLDMNTMMKVSDHIEQAMQHLTTPTPTQ